MKENAKLNRLKNKHCELTITVNGCIINPTPTESQKFTENRIAACKIKSVLYINEYLQYGCIIKQNNESYHYVSLAIQRNPYFIH